MRGARSQALPRPRNQLNLCHAREADVLAPRCLAPVPSLPLVGAGDGDGAYAYLVAQRAEADALLRERERLSHELAEREAAGRRAEAARRVAAARRDAAAAGRAKAANADAIKGAAHPKHREPT